MAVFTGSGSAAAPSITFSSDTNTGIWNPTGDTIAVSTGGSERLRVNSSGQLLLNTTSGGGAGVRNAVSLTGNSGSVFGYSSEGVLQPDVITARLYHTQAQTASNGGTPYTISNLSHVNISQSTFNADSTVTNQYGVHVTNVLTGATNNYGFYGNIPAGTNRWNFYANGTATNFFAGNVGIGVTAPIAKTHIMLSDLSGYTSPQYDGLVIERNDNVGLSLAGPNNCAIFFADGGSANIGAFEYDHATNSLVTRVNGATRTTILSTGAFLVGKTSSGTAPAQSLAWQTDVGTGPVRADYGVSVGTTDAGSMAILRGFRPVASWTNGSTQSLQIQFDDAGTYPFAVDLKIIGYRTTPDTLYHHFVVTGYVGAGVVNDLTSTTITSTGTGATNLTGTVTYSGANNVYNITITNSTGVTISNASCLASIISYKAYLVT